MTEQQVVDWVPDDAPDAPISLAEWDGTRTRLRVARNVWRGDKDARGNPQAPRIVGRGEAIEFEAAVVLDDSGRKVWVGPEAQHVQDLFAMGCIVNTQAAEALDAAIRSAETERGAWPDGSSQPVLTELRQKTRDELYRLMLRAGGRTYVLGSVKERLRVDRQEARRREDNTGAMLELASAIRDSSKGGGGQSLGEAIQNLSDQQVQELIAALSNRVSQPMDNDQEEWPGGQGPGTHPSARRRRQQQEPEPPPVEE